MSDAIIVALISGGVSLSGIIITSMATLHKTETVLKVNQAVTDTRLDTLTAEVRQHNNFAVNIPVMQEQIKVINHRLDDLERGS